MHSIDIYMHELLISSRKRRYIPSLSQTRVKFKIIVAQPPHIRFGRQTLRFPGTAQR